MADPYGTLGYESGIQLSGDATSGFQGIRSLGARGGENEYESFEVPSGQAGRYSQEFDRGGTPYWRTGMGLQDFQKAYGGLGSFGGFNPNSYIEDPTYGFAAPKSQAYPIIDEAGKLQTQANSSGFWNGAGPFMLALSAFAPALMAGGLGAGGGIAGLEAGGGAGATMSAAGAGVGGSGGFTLPGWEAAGQSGMLQSLPGMTAAPGAMSGVDAAMAGFSGAGAAGAGAGLGGEFDPIEQMYKQTLNLPVEEAAGPGAAASSGVTPPASMSGMLQALGSGVSLKDIASLGLSSFGDVGNMFSRAAFGSGGGGGFSPFGGFGGSGIGNIFDIGRGVYGLSQSKKLQKLMQQYAQQADPQAPYRPARAAELDSLMKNPSNVTKDPGYQAGLEAVQRSMASQGYQGSGNMMVALQKYGGDFFNNAVARLNGLAGGNPGQAAAIGSSGVSDSINLAGQSLNSLGYGAGRLLSRGMGV